MTGVAGALRSAGSAVPKMAISRLLMAKGARSRGLAGSAVRAPRNKAARLCASVTVKASQTSSTSRWYSGSVTIRCASMPSPSSACSVALMRDAILKQRRLFMVGRVWGVSPTMRHPQPG
jgi:hypothetical protein